jgi:hypothetical protein
MAKKFTLRGVDPLDIFLHGKGFLLAGQVLSRDELNKNNPHLMAELGQPVMVLSALTSEIFMKCLICMETGLVPSGHDLDDLFKKLSPSTRSEIEHRWDTEVVPLRNEIWITIETSMGKPIQRDLLSALRSGKNGFEKIRYSYEGETQHTQFYIGDLPTVLIRVILQRKPEWQWAVRQVTRVPGSQPGQPQS